MNMFMIMKMRMELCSAKNIKLDINEKIEWIILLKQNRKDDSYLRAF